MTPQPIVSVIVLNWNGKHYLETCLSSLLGQTYQSLEIILVDNGSADGSVEFVRDRFPEVTIIENDTNLGFAKGVNTGIKASSGRYIATINNDAEADANWVSELVRVMESEPKIGCCGSKMMNYYDRDIIDSTGIEVYHNGNAYDRGAREKDIGQYGSQEEIFGACAGAALYRKQMLDEIGLFDMSYFAYLEDVDLSFRMHLFSWKCVFVPGAVVYHMHSATSKQASPFKLFYLERNKLWNLWKYYPLDILIMQLPYTNISYLKYLKLFFNKFNQKIDGDKEPVLNYSFISIVLAVLRAKISAYAVLPYIIKQRMKFRSLGADLSLLKPWIIKGYNR